MSHTAHAPVRSRHVWTVDSEPRTPEPSQTDWTRAHRSSGAGEHRRARLSRVTVGPRCGASTDDAAGITRGVIERFLSRASTDLRSRASGFDAGRMALLAVNRRWQVGARVWVPRTPRQVRQGNGRIPHLRASTGRVQPEPSTHQVDRGDHEQHARNNPGDRCPRLRSATECGPGRDGAHS